MSEGRICRRNRTCTAKHLFFGWVKEQRVESWATMQAAAPAPSQHQSLAIWACMKGTFLPSTHKLLMLDTMLRQEPARFGWAHAV